MLNLTDEALYTAERGRAQALRDALKINYGLKLLSPRSNESEEAIDFILRNRRYLFCQFLWLWEIKR